MRERKWSWYWDKKVPLKISYIFQSLKKITFLYAWHMLASIALYWESKVPQNQSLRKPTSTDDDTTLPSWLEVSSLVAYQKPSRVFQIIQTFLKTRVFNIMKTSDSENTAQGVLNEKYLKHTNIQFHGEIGCFFVIIHFVKLAETTWLLSIPLWTKEWSFVSVNFLTDFFLCSKWAVST